MPAIMLLLAALVLELSLAFTAEAARCRPCAFSGAATDTPRCVTNGGILLFNSVPPNVPAYWTLFANARGRRTLGRLVGRLRVRSDVVDPGVPGFPGELRDGFYFGETARFDGSVEDDHVQAVASYDDGSSCEFALTLGFEVVPEDNSFVCRDPADNVVAQGAVDVQGIRLRGCKKRARARY
jgi:hypothetical protein